MPPTTKPDLLSRLLYPSSSCLTTMRCNRKKSTLLSRVQLRDSPTSPTLSLASRLRSNSLPRLGSRMHPSALDLLDRMTDPTSHLPSDVSTPRVSPGSFRRKLTQPRSLSSSDRLPDRNSELIAYAKGCQVFLFTVQFYPQARLRPRLIQSLRVSFVETRS